MTGNSVTFEMRYDDPDKVSLISREPKEESLELGCIATSLTSRVLMLILSVQVLGCF